VLLAPLCEELLFRWLPLRWLAAGRVRAGALGRPAWAALAALQVAFALCHLPRLAEAAGGYGRELARPLAELAAAGGVLAAVAVATRSLAAPLALHVALNALVVAHLPALTRVRWWAALLGGALALAAVAALRARVPARAAARRAARAARPSPTRCACRSRRDSC
jgi:membrane protease YdiL (CAAX protease family)